MRLISSHGWPALAVSTLAAMALQAGTPIRINNHSKEVRILDGMEFFQANTIYFTLERFKDGKSLGVTTYGVWGHKPDGWDKAHPSPAHDVRMVITLAPGESAVLAAPGGANVVTGFLLCNAAKASLLGKPEVEDIDDLTLAFGDEVEVEGGAKDQVMLWHLKDAHAGKFLTGIDGKSDSKEITIIDPQ